MNEIREVANEPLLGCFWCSRLGALTDDGPSEFIGNGLTTLGYPFQLTLVSLLLRSCEHD